MLIRLDEWNVSYEEGEIHLQVYLVDFSKLQADTCKNSLKKLAKKMLNQGNLLKSNTSLAIIYRLPFENYQ